jgi:hypothetical protein
MLQDAGAGDRHRMAGRQRHEAFDARGHHRCQLPADQAAPVVADQVHLVDLQGVQQAEHVGPDLVQRVVEDVRRGVGAAVAAQVGRDDAETGAGQHRHLLAPDDVGVGKTVQQQDHRPLPGRGGVDADAVRIHHQGFVDHIHLL